MAFDERWRLVCKAAWVVMMAAVTVGSLLPAESSIFRFTALLHLSDKFLHFGAYLLLAALPVVGLSTWRRGMAAGLSMFALSMVLEGLQSWAPGRTVELADVLANGAGVGCGALVGLPVRAWVTVL